MAHEKLNKSGPFRVAPGSPKAKVRGSNPLGRANQSNTTQVAWATRTRAVSPKRLTRLCIALQWL
jgi:hypothetical protein